VVFDAFLPKVLALVPPFKMELDHVLVVPLRDKTMPDKERERK
jgi:hypothetical protein